MIIFQTDNIDGIIEKINKFADSIQMKNKELEYNDETEDESITEKYKHNYDLDMEKEKTNKYYLIIMYF